MTRNIKTIAWYTFREATQNRLFRLTFAGLVCLLGIAEFTGELAITETREIQAALLASIARWFLVVTSSLFVITSMVREFNDKGTELILSLPVSRVTYYFGKFIGFIALSLAISFSVCLILFLYTEPSFLFTWYASLVCEIAIIIAMSMLCLFTFNNVTVSFIVVVAFYILARSMSAILLLSTSPILETKTFSQEFITAVVNAVAFMMPDLARFSRSDWLVYGIADANLRMVILQTVIYLILLVAAGLFDLSRKEL
jgi:ABC-type transport system involved in multi-copper enzyme maturation permease subunit